MTAKKITKAKEVTMDLRGTRGMSASVSWVEEDGCWFRRLHDTPKGNVVFEAEDDKHILSRFIEAVDDYLDFLAENDLR